MKESLTTHVKRLHEDVRALVSAITMQADDSADKKLVMSLRRELNDLRLDIRDYEFAENKTDQQKAARAALKRIDKLRKILLALSDAGFVSSVDVAAYSARFDMITKELQDE